MMDCSSWGGGGGEKEKKKKNNNSDNDDDNDNKRMNIKEKKLHILQTLSVTWNPQDIAFDCNTAW